MSEEKWWIIIEHELKFYQNYPILEAEIQQKLQENETDIQIAVLRVEKDGRMTSYVPSVESQAIKRVTVRDTQQARLNRAKKRVDRLFNALNQLSEEEYDVIDYLYLDTYYKPYDVARLLGYKNIQELFKVRDSTLQSVLRIYEKEREDFDIQDRLERKAMRIEMGRRIRASS